MRTTASPGPEGVVALVSYGAVAFLVGALVRVGIILPGIGHLGSALVALLFLYAPGIAGAWLWQRQSGPVGLRGWWAAWRRGDALHSYGFHAAPLRHGLAIAGVAIAVMVPTFGLGYLAFYELACDSSWLVHLVPRNVCNYYGGLVAVHAPEIFTRQFGEFVLVQLIVVALPEEVFFRGFLLQLLEQRFPPRRRIAGGGVGLALVISAVAFALIHVPKDWDPRALATFFPALLFGWMRSATGSILASTLTHTAANVMVRLLELSLLR